MVTGSPYEPPKSVLVDEHNSEISRKGRYVIFEPGVEWPSRCFKCNDETDHKKEVKLFYVNPWIYLSILINVLITIILAAIFQKKFTVQLPICEYHQKKRRHFLIFQWAMVALLLVSLITSFMAEIEFLLAISALAFILIVISAIFGRLAFASRYKNGLLWVTGAGKDFLNSLSNF